MACKRWRSWQVRLSRGKRSERTAAAWARHAASCPDCRAAAAWDELLGQALKRLQAPPVSPGFNARVWARIEAGPAWQRRRAWWPAAVAGLAAAGAAGAAVLFLVHPLESPQAPAPLQVVAAGQAAAPTAQAGASERTAQLPPASRTAPGPRGGLLPEEAAPLPVRSGEKEPQVARVGEAQEPKAMSQPAVSVQAGARTVPAPGASMSAAQLGTTRSTAAVGTPSSGEVRLSPNKINLSRGDRMRLEMNLGQAAAVKAIIYTRTGERVWVLQDGELSPGVHTLEWDGRTENGRTAASGIYLLVVGGGVPEKRFKIAVIK
jgi:hypothetical protein